MSAVEGDTRWLDRRSGEEGDSFRLQDSAMAGTDASASDRAFVAAAKIIRENLFQEQQNRVTRIETLAGIGVFEGSRILIREAKNKWSAP